MQMLQETPCAADRWREEQLFEEDIRAVMTLLRPNRRERLKGWNEYRTGGAQFRVTVSWEDEFARPVIDDNWSVPRLAEVLEALLVGSARNGDDLTPEEEFELYRQVISELSERLKELEACYT
jgi:hypothetical protein